MINKGEQSLDEGRRFIADLKKLQQDVLDLKTRQLTGGGSVVLGRTTSLLVMSLLPLTRANTRFAFRTANRDLFQSEFGFSVFFDVDNDYDHVWPDGNTLTAAQRDLRREWHYDPASSDESTGGHKSYILSLTNNSSTVTLNIYLHVTLDYPLIPVTAS